MFFPMAFKRFFRSSFLASTNHNHGVHVITVSGTVPEGQTTFLSVKPVPFWDGFSRVLHLYTYVGHVYFGAEVCRY
jgi:hypothetical protein